MHFAVERRGSDRVVAGDLGLGGDDDHPIALVRHHRVEDHRARPQLGEGFHQTFRLTQGGKALAASRPTEGRRQVGQELLKRVRRNTEIVVQGRQALRLVCCAGGLGLEGTPLPAKRGDLVSNHLVALRPLGFFRRQGGVPLEGHGRLGITAHKLKVFGVFQEIEHLLRFGQAPRRDQQVGECPIDVFLRREKALLERLVERLHLTPNALQEVDCLLAIENRQLGLLLVLPQTHEISQDMGLTGASPHLARQR